MKNLKKTKIKSPIKILLILLIAFAIFHIIMGNVLNLTDDEAYYWVWSHFLHLSYYDHPPMIAYLIFVFTKIFGHNNIAVRLPAIFCLTITSFVIYKIYFYLYKDEAKAILTVFIFNIIPLFAMAGDMSLPDLPLMLFFTISIYIFIKIVYEENYKLFYLLGVLVGLGCLSKYNMFLFYPSIFFYLLFFKREIFKKKELYIGFFISIILFMPVLIWNFNHHWVSFTFQFYKRQSHKFVIKWFLMIQFVLSQVLIVTPFIFISMFCKIYKNFKEKDVKILTFFGTFIFGTFFLASFFSRFKIHWAALAYIPFLIILVRYSKFNNLNRFLFIIFPILLTVLTFTQAIYPILPIPKQQDITTDMHGWNIVGKKVENIYKSLNKNHNWFLFSSRYQLSSQLFFYLPNREYVYCLEKDQNGYSYLKKNQSSNQSLKGKNGIFVTHSFYFNDPNNLYDFKRIKLLKKIYIKRAGVIYRTFFIYLCYGYNGLK